MKKCCLNNINCGQDRQLCLKFIIIALISLGTTIFGIVMLSINKFENTVLTSICFSLISSNLAYWCHPPNATETIIEPN